MHLKINISQLEHIFDKTSDNCNLFEIKSQLNCKKISPKLLLKEIECQIFLCFQVLRFQIDCSHNEREYSIQMIGF